MSVFVKLNYQIILVLEKMCPGSVLLFDLMGRKFCPVAVIMDYPMKTESALTCWRQVGRQL